MSVSVFILLSDFLNLFLKDLPYLLLSTIVDLNLVWNFEIWHRNLSGTKTWSSNELVFSFTFFIIFGTKPRVVLWITSKSTEWWTCICWVNMKKENIRIGYRKVQIGPRKKLFVHICPLFSACVGETVSVHKKCLAAKLANVKLLADESILHGNDHCS